MTNPTPTPIPNPEPPAPETRIRTNRANATLSTGPRTAAGKQRSSQNALTHGLTSRSPVLPSEDPAAYHLHCRQFLDEYQPATPNRIPSHPGTRRHRLASQTYPPTGSRAFLPSPQPPNPNPAVGHPRPALPAPLPPVPKNLGPPPRNPIRAPPRRTAPAKASRGPPRTP
jgi:hypothetical protein